MSWPTNKANTTYVDSDADPATGITGVYSLVSGEDDLTVDAGVFA